MRDMEGWLPCLDNTEKLYQYLGLSDKKPIPDPVKFQEADPLGASYIYSIQQGTNTSTDGI